MAGDADDAIRTELGAGLAIGRILLADMDSVASGAQGQIGPIVHDEGDAAILNDGTQAFGHAQDGIVANLLQPQLHGGHIVGIERLRKDVGESRGIVDARRRDQVEATA